MNVTIIPPGFCEPAARSSRSSPQGDGFRAGAGSQPWGSVLLPAVPVMTLLLAVGPRLLPEFRDPEAGRLDLISAGLSLVAVLAVIYGLKQIAQDGPGWPPVLAIVAGLAVGGAFLHRQGRLADPLIELRLFRAPAFSAALAAYTLGFFVNFGALLFIAQYLQLVLGLSPLEAGAWMVPSAAGFVVGSTLTPVIVRRVRPGSAVAAGLALAAIGFGLLTQVDADSGLAVLVTGSVVFSLGLAAVFTLATDLMVGTAPPERAGAASATSSRTRSLPSCSMRPARRSPRGCSWPPGSVPPWSSRPPCSPSCCSDACAPVPSPRRIPTRTGMRLARASRRRCSRRPSGGVVN
jgi:hypothetical protein